MFKDATARAGPLAPFERRSGADQRTVEEEMCFLDQADVQDGRTGLMLQTMLETGTRASELVQLRVENVSLAECVSTIRHGKSDKRRELPTRRDLPSAGIPNRCAVGTAASSAQLLPLQIDARWAGPLFTSRKHGSVAVLHTLLRQRVGQVVLGLASTAGITRRVCPHLLRHTIATRLLALGMNITDLQRLICHESITTTRYDGRQAPTPIRSPN